MTSSADASEYLSMTKCSFLAQQDF
ncbi:MAG: hypothetical protein QOF78_691, partial [Phycisphaerales bacterium]|nr:hypothetical protein [Phycisphaerales bacterium]